MGNLSSPSRLCLALATLLAALTLSDHPLAAGALASVSPSGASAGVSISITGTGFDASAANNEVSFAGTTTTARGAGIALLDDATGLRRLTVTVPAGVPVGRSTLEVKNTTTGAVVAGVALDVLDVRLGAIATVARAASNVAVPITGSASARFVAGATRVVFGSGITVQSVAVQSPTSLVATIAVAASAPTGARTIAVITSTQTALVSGFTVTDAVPTNRPPTFTSTAIASASESRRYTYQASATDPDGDAIGFALATAPAGMTISSSGLVDWTPAATQTGNNAVSITATDPAGGVATQTFTIAVAANAAPTITSTAPGTATQSIAYRYDIAASDADGDPLTFRLLESPSGMSIAPIGRIDWTPDASQVKTHHVVVEVDDDRGGRATQPFDITVSTTTTNRSPFAHPGGPYHGDAGAPIAFSGAGSSDPDGDPLSFSWSFGDGSAPASGDSPTHVYDSGGSFIVTLTVTDGHGGASSQATTVAVGAAGDRSPPSVTLVGPRESLPGDQVTFTAQADDNVKVEKVTFDVDGANPTDVTAPPYQRSVAVPPVAAPGTTIAVRATAIDSSGNSASAETTLTIKTKPDSEKPTVRMSAPPLASPGSTIHVSASADDNSGIQSVGFSVNGASLLTLTAPPYEATYDIPASTPIGAALTIDAFAVDFSANRSDETATITIVDTPDTVAPTVQLTAAATTTPGALLSLAASAADNRGIAAVRFYVDGVRIATDTDAPYAASFAVPQNAEPGRVFQLEARAIDFAGLEGIDSRQATVAAASTAAPGVLTGEVYDDTTGLPVEGAVISLSGADNSGLAYSQTASSDRRGRYLLQASEGRGALHITRDGWTRVDRIVDIAANKSVEAVDARLTPLTSAGAAALDPVLGGTVNGPAGSQIALIVSAGALAAAAPLAVTSIGGQALEGLLPIGWSPVAAVDVTPHAVAFASPAALTIPAGPAVQGGAALVVARWDEAAAEWRAVATTTAAAAGPLGLDLTSAGQYVWALADVLPAAPPAPAIGAALAGVAPQQIPADATTVVSPQSKIVFYQPGVRTDVAGLVSASTLAPSGTLVFSRISESYRFTSGLDANLDPYVEDVVLYQAGSGAAQLSAHFTVTPSIAFEPTTLQSGVITVELFEPAVGARQTDAIGTDGGSASAPTGERVDVPANALSTPAAVSVRAISADDLGFAVPAPLTFAGGLELSSSGAQFTSPVTLSVPKPAQIAPDSQILVARVAEVGSTTRLVLVAVGRIAGDRIETSGDLPSCPSCLEGPRAAGRYVFLRPGSPVGFAHGVIRAINGDPFAGALVSVDTLPLFALSRATGEYVAAAAVGAVSVSALDVVRNDTGFSQATIAAANTVVAVDVRLSAQPPRVISITPTDQADNVPLSNPVVVTFSEPLNPSTVTTSSIVVSGPGGTPVSGTLALSSENSVVTFRPSAPFPSDTAFTVTVAATITDLSGYTLTSVVTSHFASLDTAAPPPPAAGSITATMPAADGTSTITATQGTAGPRDTVAIVNKTRGTTTPVLLDPNGGFSVIVPVALADVLQLRIVDAAGNTTLVDVPRFSRDNADGSRSVAIPAEGGVVQGPGGVSASIKPGTFPDGAIVTIKPVAEAAFPVQMTAEQKQFFGFVGGVDLDFGGKVPTQYINVSVPPGPDDTPDNQWVVGLVKEVNGQKVMHVVDTAKLIDGRVTTSSPPCPGAAAQGVYGFLKSNYPMGLTYGNVSTSLLPIIGKYDYPIAAVFLFMPYVIAIDPQISEPMCLPVLSGRVTISPNTVTVTLNGRQLTPDVAKVRIANDTNHSEVAFDRESLSARVTVPGSPADVFSVTGDFGAGKVVPMFFKKETAAAGSIDIVFDVDQIVMQAPTIRILNATTGNETAVPGNSLELKFSIAGGMHDIYRLLVLGPKADACCPAPFKVSPSADGDGNLVARALPGTIDPTRAEIDAFNATHDQDHQLRGRARTKVQIINRTTHEEPEVPANTIVSGGFSFSFGGTISDDFAVLVTYDDGSTDGIPIPTFRFTITNPDTGEVIKAITLPSPPADHPLALGTLSDDTVAPTFTSDLMRLNAFDPGDFLTFTFSEPMNPDTLKTNLKVKDRSGKVLDGFVIVSAGNTSATWIPRGAPLAFAESYTVTFDGVVDRGGNQLAVRNFSLNTIAPHLVSTFQTNPGPFAIQDIQFLTHDRGDINPEAIILATTASKLGNSIVTVDVTQPDHPTAVGTAQAGQGKRQATVVHGVSGLTLAGTNPCAPGGNVFNGDLAITTSWVWEFTYVSFIDARNPAAPCQMANKILTATPDSDLIDAVDHGTYLMFGAGARGVAAIKHPQGVVAYSAIPEAGLMVTDVGLDIPEKPGSQRVKEPMRAGNYYDVVARAGRLLALNRDTKSLEVLDPTLALVGSVLLPDAPRRLIVADGFPFDGDGDGVVSSGEFVNAVFVGGDKSIMMLDVNDATAPRVIGQIAMPAPVMDLDVKSEKRRLVVADVRGSLYLIDIATIQAGSIVDSNHDGVDDRIVWTRQIADSINAVRFDPDLAFVYVGTTRGLEVYGMGAPNLTGTATYTYYPVTDVPDPVTGAVGVDYPHVQVKKIRGAIVELHAGSATGTLLQSTTTDETGYYSFDAPQGTPLVVVVRAELGRPGNIHLDVVDNVTSVVTDPIGLDANGFGVLGANKVWAKASPVFNVVGSKTQDIFAKTVWTPGAPTGTYSPREAAPFAILDQVFQGEKVMRGADPVLVFPMLHMGWSPNNQPTNGEEAAGNVGIAHYSSDDGTLYLLGKENVNTDEYDAQTVMHEWSHYVQDKIFGRDDSVGGPHSSRGTEKLDPRVAFSEGFATAHAAMMTGNSLKVQTDGANQASLGVDYDVEVDNSSTTGFTAESTVYELLWDLFDPVSGSDADSDTGGGYADSVYLDYKPIYEALRTQAASPAFTTILSLLKPLATKYLSDPDPAMQAVGAQIVALAKAENIDLTAADEYELSAYKLYTTVTVDAPLPVTHHGAGPYAGQPLQTRKANDPGKDGNKLDEYVYFKFTAATAGNYDITVIPTDGAAMNIQFNDRHKGSQTKNNTEGKTITLTVPISAPGDYTLTVGAKRFESSKWNHAVDAKFAISISYKGALPTQ